MNDTIHIEAKEYMPPKENPVNVAPWWGTNTKNPTEYDIRPDIPTDEKVDITSVETNPLVEDIKRDQEAQIAAMKRKPRLLEAGVILLVALYAIKVLFVGKPEQT